MLLDYVTADRLQRSPDVLCLHVLNSSKDATCTDMLARTNMHLKEGRVREITYEKRREFERVSRHLVSYAQNVPVLSLFLSIVSCVNE